MSTLSSCSTLLPMRGVIGRERSARTPKQEQLSFFCTWEQNSRAFGSNPILLCYFPSDDSIELRQVPRGSKAGPFFAAFAAGCVSAPLVSKRQRVAKPYFQGTTKQGAGGARPCRPAEGFYHWTDLAIGKPLLICGMSLLLQDADAAAHAHFEKHGHAITADNLDTAVVNSTLGHTTLSSTALLRSPSTATTSFANYTHRGTPVMRFAASMTNAPGFDCTRSDLQRRFVLSFHLDDDTLELSEPPNKATHTGGANFFPRQLVSKPDLSDPYTCSGKYNRKDLTLGALVPVLLKARKGYEAEGPKMLQLLSADEWTLDFMESRPHEFPASQGAGAVDKLAQEVAAAACAQPLLHLMATGAPGTHVPVEALASWLSGLGCDVTMQEVVTFARHTAVDRASDVVSKAAIVQQLGLPEYCPPEANSMRLRPMTAALTSTRTGLNKTRSQSARPSTAATLGKLSKSAATNAFGTQPNASDSRIGSCVFGPDPEHNKYYNRTEHGTYLIREALNQKTGSLPAWA